MKIAFLIGSMAESGGIERVTANLANMWIKLGYKVDVVVLDKNETSFFIMDSKVKIISLNIENYDSLFNMAKWYIDILKKFRKYLKNNKPDIVFGIWTSMATSAIMAASFLKIPVVACEHIAFCEVRKSLQFLRKFIYPFANTIVSLTDTDSALYKKMNSNSLTIPNAILNVENNQPVNNNSKIILAVGRIVPQKGFDLLILAWAKIAARYPEWKLKIIGRKDDKHKVYIESLYSLIRQYNLSSQIIIANPTSNIFHEYKNAEFFVMSSRFEGLPMVLLEAMSVGLAVISFDCPTGPREIIEHKQNGILVEKNNIDALSESITQYIEDKDFRSKMAMNAQKHIVVNFGEEKVCTMWKSLTDKILRDKKR